MILGTDLEFLHIRHARMTSGLLLNINKLIAVLIMGD